MDVIHEKLTLLPEKPGVYLMKDAANRIIYVGKAKILKNRVRSYFTGSHDGKTQKMVSNVVDFEYILTDSEVEALVLECNLIKKYNPKYNILLRDDKTYPYITITDELHPRILVTRQVKKGSGKYFGPYPNSGAAREAAHLLNRLFPFRKCRQIPSRACLYYHLGQCLGPCVREVSPHAYDEVRKEATAFLRGGQDQIINLLEEKMAEAAQALKFERAQEYKDLIGDLKRLNEKQNITLTDFVDRDVLGYAVTTDQMCIQIFYLRQGKVIARDNYIFPYYEEPEEAFNSFLVQFYTNNVCPQEILVPENTVSELEQILPIVIPHRGKKLDLVQMAIQNASNTLNEQTLLESRRLEETAQALETLGQLLHIDPPHSIEAFDNSHTGGAHAVGGMVQFIQGKPERSNYRKYKIQPMETNDDTAAIRQIITRRYQKVLTGELVCPDLILLDGGKGQIHAAAEALAQLGLNIPLAGMVKNEHHQTAGLINQKDELLAIEKRSPAFHLLERIQDEVHRFAITFHRQQRAKSMTLSELDHINGIGPKRRRQLMQYFPSIGAVKEADIPELIKSGLPAHIAEAVYQHFRSSTSTQSDKSLEENMNDS